MTLGHYVGDSEAPDHSDDDDWGEQAHERSASTCGESRENHHDKWPDKVELLLTASHDMCRNGDGNVDCTKYPVANSGGERVVAEIDRRPPAIYGC